MTGKNRTSKSNGQPLNRVEHKHSDKLKMNKCFYYYSSVAVMLLLLPLLMMCLSLSFLLSLSLYLQRCIFMLMTAFHSLVWQHWSSLNERFSALDVFAKGILICNHQSSMFVEYKNEVTVRCGRVFWTISITCKKIREQSHFMSTFWTISFMLLCSNAIYNIFNRFSSSAQIIWIKWINNNKTRLVSYTMYQWFVRTFEHDTLDFD